MRTQQAQLCMAMLRVLLQRIKGLFPKVKMMAKLLVMLMLVVLYRVMKVVY